MRLPPPEVVASWPTPNYTNPETQAPTLLIVELTTLSIALICLGLRLYARKRILGQYGCDDWLMMGAAFFGTAVTTCVVLAFVRYGWDIHVWDLTLHEMVSGRKVSFAAQALFVPATSLAKVSILVSYLRLARHSLRFRRAIYCAIAFVVALNVCFLFVGSGDTAQPSHHDGRCRLRCVGVANTCPLPCQETYDVTWYGFHLWMWTAVEVHLGIICGCVPWLKSLFRFWQRQRDLKRNNQTATNLSVAELIDTKGRPCRQHSERKNEKAAKGESLVRVTSVGSASTRRSRGSESRWDRAREEWEDLERGSIYINPGTAPPVEPASMLPRNLLVPPAHAALRTDRPVGPVNELPPDTPGLAF
ncbi:uncharacterized protein B0H64DRAFT_452362 [Chaetomium fimeti]|uniref:Rhodopsin domain-containing protein n=1 Tax=Chaetomium fimeti TaxID=1854472 RepID=A0AAE0LMR5_9PEZI|nr:hypothetical protein B0H64DRAFT_452362 [Chaetomium fimeti]